MRMIVISFFQPSTLRFHGLKSAAQEVAMQMWEIGVVERKWMPERAYLGWLETVQAYRARVVG